MKEFKIDRFFCINMDRRVDRWIQTKNELFDVGIEAERFSAFPHSRFKDKVDGKNRCGLIESNRVILSWCKEETVCIFEDDVTFVRKESLVKQIANMHLEDQLPENWGFILLGGYVWGKRRLKQISKNLIEVKRPDFIDVKEGEKNHVGGTHAVIYSAAAVEKLKEMNDQQWYRVPLLDVLIQEWIAGEFGMPCFCLYPMLAHQREDYSDLEGHTTIRDSLISKTDRMIDKL